VLKRNKNGKLETSKTKCTIAKEREKKLIEKEQEVGSKKSV
jgi:hypothetical protein